MAAPVNGCRLPRLQWELLWLHSCSASPSVWAAAGSRDPGAAELAATPQDPKLRRSFRRQACVMETPRGRLMVSSVTRASYGLI